MSQTATRNAAVSRTLWPVSALTPMSLTSKNSIDHASLAWIVLITSPYHASLRAARDHHNILTSWARLEAEALDPALTAVALGLARLAVDAAKGWDPASE
jgi:hypothetical protein